MKKKLKLQDFQCTKCGECCRHIDSIDGLKHLQKDGICKYLINNQCSIYNTRPNLCRRDKVFEMFKDVLSEDEFTQILIKVCNELKEQAHEK